MGSKDLFAFLALMFVAAGGLTLLMAITPIGKAIAARIAGRKVSDEGLQELREANQAVLDELHHLRDDVAELSERVDFTERLLARQREGGVLPPGAP